MVDVPPIFSRRLVLHADDLGLNRAVSDGILRGFHEGVLTSTAVMANAPDAARALERFKLLLAEQKAGALPSDAARRRLGDCGAPFDLGVHLNLTQGRPLTGNRFPAELLDAQGRFLGVFALFRRLRRIDPALRAAVREELCRQIEIVLDHGLQPTHLNGHQYVEMMPVVAGILPELLERYRIRAVRVAVEPALWRTTVWRSLAVPGWLLAHVKGVFARRFRARVQRLGARHAEAFFGTAHAGRIDLGLMGTFLASCNGARLVEIGLHPGERAAASTDDADGWRDPLAERRPAELRMVTSPELTEQLAASGFQLGRLGDENRLEPRNVM